MVRGRDACWEHCVLVDASRQKVRCNYCHREFSGGVYRMKFHLAQIRNKDIIPCTNVPNNVRDIIQGILSTPKKQKTSKRLMVEQTVNGHQKSSSASGGALPIGESSEQNGSVCPSLFQNASPDVQPEPTVYDDQKQKHDDADKKIALFFLYNAIPFGAATSTYYQEMVHSIAECGADYKAPSSEKLRYDLLDKVKDDVNNMHKNLREEWQETGCTILCDFWSDGRTKSLVVFSVTCPKGTIFLRSIDVSAHAEDTHFLFGLLESVVLEVGIESVVQVLTDSADSFTYAGKLLVDKYPSIFWSPCASQCIKKMLEDFSKLGWVNTVLEEATTVTKYIYSNECLLHTVQRFCGGMELRSKLSRYIADFLSLRYLVLQEENLKHYVISQVEFWPSSACRQSDAHLIRAILKSEEFWRAAREAVSISEPLMKTLRMVEGDMPAMGYLYEGIERAKLSIKAYYNGIAERYLPILDIIERRWNMQLYSSLHAAAGFLNPATFFSLTFKVDARMRNGFQEAMMKMAINDVEKTEITKEHPVYINAQGALGTEFARKGRMLNSPGDWWAAYGYEIPTLQRHAIQILIQPCSSQWCRWNWSNFGNLHSKRLDREELDKLSDLVFVRCNLWLQEIIQNRGRHCKPVIFEEIDVNSEWPSESEMMFPFLGDNSILDNVPS